MTGPDPFRALATSILPPGVERGVRGGTRSLPLESQSFASLLAREASGSLASGRPVSVREGSGLELSEQQLSRIGAALDRAEAAGAQRAVVLVDGQALRVDVGVRQIVERVDLQSISVLPGIDAIVQAGDQRSAPGAGAGNLLGTTAMHPDLARLLGTRPDPADRAA